MQQEVQVTKTNEDEIDLLDLIGVLFRHKWLIIVTTAAAALLILLYSILSLKLPPEKSFLPNKFKPVSTVKINSGDGGGGLASLMGSSDLGALGSLIGLGETGNSNAALAMKLATSRTILDQIADEFDLMTVYEIDSDYPVTDLREAITENLSLTEDGATNTLAISYEDIDRELATKIVNRLVGILEEAFTVIDRDSNRSQKELLEQKIVDVDRQMRELQDEILAFQRENDVLDATTMAQELTTKVMELKTDLTIQEAELAIMTERSPRQDPNLRLKQLEVAGLKEILSALEHGEGSANLPAMRDMPQIVLAYEEKRRLLEAQASIYAALLQQYELLKLQDRGSGPTFQVIEYAEVPEMKSGPSRGKLCIIVTMAAFFLSIFSAFLKEFWDNLRKDPARMDKLKGKTITQD